MKLTRNDLAHNQRLRLERCEKNFIEARAVVNNSGATGDEFERQLQNFRDMRDALADRKAIILDELLGEE